MTSQEKSMATSSSHTTTIGIATELYRMINTIRFDERKRTMKEVADELLLLGIAVKQGEYVRRKGKKNEHSTDALRNTRTV